MQQDTRLLSQSNTERPPVELQYLFLVFLCFLFSCATFRGVMEPGRAGSDRIIEGVPFFPQETYQCGPASMAGVLNYWGIEVSSEAIAEEIYSRSAKGTLSLDMTLYASNKGLEAVQYEGCITDLKKNIDLGYPLIVLVDYGFWVYQQNHFMVVIGYNRDGIIVNSGKEWHKVIPVKDFLKQWKKTNYWTLLIGPRLGVTAMLEFIRNKNMK